MIKPSSTVSWHPSSGTLGRRASKSSCSTITCLGPAAKLSEIPCLRTYTLLRLAELGDKILWSIKLSFDLTRLAVLLGTVLTARRSISVKGIWDSIYAGLYSAGGKAWSRRSRALSSLEVTLSWLSCIEFSLSLTFLIWVLRLLESFEIRLLSSLSLVLSRASESCTVSCSLWIFSSIEFWAFWIEDSVKRFRELSYPSQAPLS